MRNNDFDDEIPELSIDGLNGMAENYDCDYMVYVEGPTDVSFGKQYFTEPQFYVDDCGGCAELDKYIDLIERHNNECKFVVARDKDFYAIYTEKLHVHPLIVYSVGHSTENMIYCPQNINEFVRRLSHGNFNDVGKVAECMDSFSDAIKELLLYDAYNQTQEDNNKPMEEKDNCLEYIKDCDVKREKINSVVAQLDTEYTASDVNQRLERVMVTSGFPLRLFIRGHFFTGLIHNLVYKNSAYSDMQGRHNGQNVQNSVLNASLSSCLPVECKQKCKYRKIILQEVEDATNFLTR